MRGADASAGTIKSGGATRRAAKMVVLDVDHPDVEDFIATKVKEEGEELRRLRERGLRHGPGRRRHHVRPVPERQQQRPRERRVHDGRRERHEFGLRARMTGEIIEKVDAKALFRKLARPRGPVPTRASSTTARDQQLAHLPPSPAGSPRRTPCSEYMHLDNTSPATSPR
ncbi:hypothetical protein QA942_34535 [Streptomyces sp. B21-106]|uniref:hypothetical protein n=1 Tax=Streptomyces sp. B21-106 TaxID=3039418 RepID=UPI002FEF51C5